jgi:hypothetical protein
MNVRANTGCKRVGFSATVVGFDCWSREGDHPLSSRQNHHADGKIASMFKFALLHQSNHCMQPERIVTLCLRLFCVAVR